MDYRIFQRSYDTFARHYDDAFEAQQVPKILGLVGALGPRPEGLVLDVGAGTGLFARTTGWSCVEVDVSPGMLRTPPRPRCVLARLDRLPFGDASAAVVISVTSLIDFEPDVAAVFEWARVLAPGGRLAVSVLKRENLPALERGLDRAGFAVEVGLDLRADWGWVARRG